MNFEEMIKKQKESNNVEKLVQAGSNEKKSYADENLWKPQVDKAGNGFAIIRFLPAPDSDIPWVKYYSHGFKSDTGKWMIEDCPTSIGQECPLCKANSELWNSGLDSDKEIVRDRKRRLHYVSNILVLKDSADPSNNGKQFLYKYGVKIHEKLMESMQPSFEDETPVNPFNLFEGCDFKLKIKKVAGYWNYDSSEFDSPSAVFDDESKLKELFDSLEPITPYVSPERYKSFDELQRKLNDVLGIPQKDSGYKSAPPPAMKEEDTPPWVSNESKTKMAETTATSVANNTPDAEEEDEMDYFKKLAAGL